MQLGARLKQAAHALALATSSMVGATYRVDAELFLPMPIEDAADQRHNVHAL